MAIQVDLPTDGLEAEGGQLRFVEEPRLCEKHEGIVGRQILLQELHAMRFERGNGVLLGGVQRRHYGLRPDRHLVN